MKTLYILYSTSRGGYYIGSTSDLHRRISEHNRGQTKSTRSGRPWEIVFFLKTPDASKLELKLKKHKSRDIINRIIKDGIRMMG